MGTSATTTTDTVQQVTSVPIDVLLISALNPRREKKLDPIELQQLADRIKANGILQPLVVRRAGKNLEVIAGRRRLEAARLAGLTEVPAIVRDLEDEAAASAATVENVQRADLRPLDLALAIAHRLDLGESVEHVAAAIGKPRGWVARRANLQKLPPALRKRLEAPGDAMRDWSLDALELLALLSPAAQQDAIAHSRWNGPPAVGYLRKKVAEECTLLDRAPWDLTDAELVPKAGACTTCPFNSANSPDLFGDLHLDEKQAAAGAVCRNQDCWSKKVSAHAARATTAAKKEHGKALLRVHGKDQTTSGNPFRNHEVRDALGSWEYTRVKEGTPGAKPAVLVSGKEVGKVVHVRVEKHAAGAARAKPAKEKPKPGSASAVKASTERLERRRMAWQVDRALEELCAITPPAADELVKISAAFGTGGIQRGAGCPGRWGKPQQVLKEYANAGPTELWAAVMTEKGGLRDQLALRRQQDLDGAHAIVERLTVDLRGQPAWRAVVDASEKEIAPPKSLQSLKQTAPAKGKAKAAPAARARKAKPVKARAARGKKA
jgi:ParB/RepB/Spo0J family partition protein